MSTDSNLEIAAEVMNAQFNRVRELEAENEKLKKLDEKVKRRIKYFAYAINNLHDVTASEYNEAIVGLRLLESLYDE